MDDEIVSMVKVLSIVACASGRKGVCMLRRGFFLKDLSMDVVLAQVLLYHGDPVYIHTLTFIILLRVANVRLAPLFARWKYVPLQHLPSVWFCVLLSSCFMCGVLFGEAICQTVAT